MQNNNETQFVRIHKKSSQTESLGNLIDLTGNKQRKSGMFVYPVINYSFEFIDS